MTNTKNVRLILDLNVDADLKLGYDDDHFTAREEVRKDMNAALEAHSGVVHGVSGVSHAGLDEAVGLIQSWYRGVVDGWAESIVSEYGDTAEDPADRPDFTEFIHEQLDGAAEVIYTFKAKMVLLASDNEDAYAEEIGEAPPDVSAAAYFALRTDVMDIISGDHPDIHDGVLATDEDDLAA